MIEILGSVDCIVEVDPAIQLEVQKKLITGEIRFWVSSLRWCNRERGMEPKGVCKVVIVIMDHGTDTEMGR